MSALALALSFPLNTPSLLPYITHASKASDYLAASLDPSFSNLGYFINNAPIRARALTKSLPNIQPPLQLPLAFGVLIEEQMIIEMMYLSPNMPAKTIHAVFAWRHQQEQLGIFPSPCIGC